MQLRYHPHHHALYSDELIQSIFYDKSTMRTSNNFYFPVLCVWPLFHLLMCQTVAQAIFQNSQPQFLSRPDINAPVFNTTVVNSTRINPGYWFLTIGEPWVQPGPYIYDNQGNLIWSGYDESQPKLATDLKIINHDGQTSLSFFRGNRHDMHAVGNGVIMDRAYKVKSQIGLPSLGFAPDEHEFNILNDGKSALITSYQVKRYDLSEFNLTSGISWILDSLFYEIDLKTNQVIYKWSALDHIDLLESQFPLSQVPGTGLTQDNAWDYFHINSVEKTADGDYLVSARHTNCIYKVSKSGGSVIWQLGGIKPSFRMDPSLNFTYQHHARIMVENTTTTIISFLDNASGSWPGTLRSSSYSRALIVALNNSSSPMTATLLNGFDNPDGRLAIAKGSIQQFPGGNMFIGWGQAGAISEVTPDGALVLHARLSPGAASYRSYKYNFTATPDDLPALWAYSMDESAPTTIYVSWNGATEVSSWKFYICDGAAGDSMAFIGHEAKKGFETVHYSARNLGWTFAEALAANGTSLGNSGCKSTFVPSNLLRPSCRAHECSIPKIGIISVESKSRKNWPATYLLRGLQVDLERYTVLVASSMAFCLGITLQYTWRIGARSISHARKISQTTHRRVFP